MPKPRFVVPVFKMCEADAASAGAKALSLARLRRIGLAVPQSFCITATAFRKHLEANELDGKIKSALDKLNSASAEDKKSILLEIRQIIVDAPLAAELREQIEEHYRRLGAGRVAVRSSATAEDLPGHSFAGQYETYLGVADLSACIDAVKKCWASLWTERAYKYREKNGFDHLKVYMAVIVQSLIEADASGVLFTADAVYGYDSRIIIEGCSGLGDSLVSGRVTPDRFVIDKKKCRILAKSSRSDSCITDSAVKKLAKLAKKAEKSFGGPQDIEWAICENKIHFLQSRPITVIPPQKTWQERQVWTNANTGEVAPDVVTPITWSILQKHLVGMLKPLVNLVSIRLGEKHTWGLVAGRVYFNLNIAIAFAKHFPGLMTPQADSMFGGEHGKLWDLVVRNTPDENLPDLHFSLCKTILKAPLSLVRILSYTAKKAGHFVDNIRIQSDRLQNLDLACLSEQELAEQLTWSVSHSTDYTGLMFVAHGMVSFVILDMLCTRCFGEDGHAIANRLFVGLSGIDSAEAGLALRRLALRADESTELRDAIFSGGNWESTRRKIAALAEGEAFLNRWEEFMAAHGHHCRGEIELFNPRWRERPDYILNIVRSYIGRPGRTSHPDDYKELARKREELTRQCRKQLKNPLKRWIFNLLLKTAQQGLILRENWKSQTVRYLTAVRRILTELGERLNKKRVLETSDDIFFLKIDEIEPVTRHKADFDIKKTIVQRRTEYEKNKTVIPPKVVIGEFDPDDYTPDTVDTDTKVLNGLAVSSGVVTGKARVVLRADTDGQVLPGEILVAPFTDPGWTPYFIPAAAIVMDIGGMLSHGSIIAREYGIPAVVNVGAATKIIKTGQTIRVDANRGTVTILGQAAS